MEKLGVKMHILGEKRQTVLVCFRFDWYQSDKTVSVVVYSKWPQITREHVIVDLRDKQLQVTLHVKQSVYTAHIGKDG